MAAYPGQSGKKETNRAGVPPALVGVAIAVVLVLVGWLAYANFFAPPAPAPLDAAGKANQDVLLTLAKKCNGDVSKLSPEEQAQAKKIAGAYAGLAMQKLLKGDAAK